MLFINMVHLLLRLDFLDVILIVSRLNSKGSTVEALVSGHPQGARKVSLTGAYEKVKIQSLYGTLKGSFDWVAVSRAVRLGECPLGKHRLYFQIISILDSCVYSLISDKQKANSCTEVII